MGFKTYVAVCSAAAMVALSGCSAADPDAWLSDNCAVATGALYDGRWGNPITYVLGVASSPVETTLLTYHRGDNTVTKNEESLPADTLVCYNAEAWVKAKNLDGSGLFFIMPVAWSDAPDWDHYVRVPTDVASNGATCPLAVDPKMAPCEARSGPFKVDRKKSADLHDNN